MTVVAFKQGAEKVALRQRARNNVEDDLRLLRDIAQKRSEHSNKQLRVLGQYELELVDTLMRKLETLP